MKKFNLTINQANKFFNTLEEALAIYNRALPFYKAMQAKYDGVQVLDYMSIDEVHVTEDNEVYPVAYLHYFDGAKLTK